MAKIYTKDEVLTFIRSVSVMNLAACLDGQPIATVLLFHVTDDFTFYFGTHDDSFKAKALRSQPKVSLSVWEHKKILVQADGIAQQLTEETAVFEALDNIVAATNNIKDFWPPVLRIEGHGYAVFQIKTTWMRALDLSSVSITEKELPFTTIVERHNG